MALNRWCSCDAGDIIKNTTEEDFHKMGPKNISSAFTVAGRSVQLHKGTIFKEM
jgi:hypothetical protein